MLEELFAGMNPVSAGSGKIAQQDKRPNPRADQKR
jgi:hypothetical protein